MRENKEIICVENLEFGYPAGNFHLTIPEFRIQEFEKIGVIGPSGSGKTTLLNLLAGILLPLKGEIFVGDQMIPGLTDGGRRDFRISQIGFVFQDFQLIDYLSILDNILHPYRITKTLNLTSNVRSRAMDLARDMGIEDKLYRHPEDLSQGEKQRAAICRALRPRPKILLADEATGNLDPANKVLILELLFKQIEASGSTLVAVTHDVELLKYFDRVIDFKAFYKKETV
jgi:putative ABC transport system ATP-binding protein